MKVKRLKWIKDDEGWFGQPPLYFRIYKNKKQWRIIIAEFWKKSGSQIRDLPVDSLHSGKILASMLWKDFLLSAKARRQDLQAKIDKLEEKLEELKNEQIEAYKNYDSDLLSRLNNERLSIAKKIGQLHSRQSASIRFKAG